MAGRHGSILEARDTTLGVWLVNVTASDRVRSGGNRLHVLVVGADDGRTATSGLVVVD